MQDAISTQVVACLHRELLPASTSGRDHGTRDVHACEMFHRVHSLYLRGIDNHSLRAAKALLACSIEIYPGFARAGA